MQDGARVAVAAAVFTTAGALIAALVAAIVSHMVSRRSVYINAVTAERSKWIEALRKNISAFSGAADRLSAGVAAGLNSNGQGWPERVGELPALLSELTLRLNPGEPEARNLLAAARKVEAAARLHTPASFRLADEIMIRHAQWVLKPEWERVKEEASGMFVAQYIWMRRRRRKAAHGEFLKADGALERLEAIGSGRSGLELTMLRAELDAPADQVSHG
jgi:hypothetical protein